MTNIPEVNWSNFGAKFYGREQRSFETLCYLLFCSEFDQDKGIFRYKNQTGIETEPIERGGEIIGWQAKFLESGISSRIRDVGNFCNLLIIHSYLSCLEA